MPSLITIRSALACLGLAAALTLACGGESGSPSDSGDILRQAGDGQSATVGTALTPYQVKVTDVGGAPAPGVTVNWSVLIGGGSVDPASSETDADGLASATATLGTTAGAQRVRATASGYSGSPVSFTSTATPDVPSKVLAVAGSGQVGGTSEVLPQQLLARVTDQHDNPIPGVTVHWAVTSGGGQVSSASTITGVDGSTGVGFVSPSVAASIVVTASVTGVGQSADFSLTAAWEPKLVGTVPIPDNYALHDTYVRDGIAFAFAWNTGVIIYDVGNGILGGSPANPKEISRVTAGGETHNGWWFHNPVTQEARYLFIGEEGPGTVGTSSSGDIHVLDVSNLASPHQVATFHLDGAGPHNFWMDEPAQILYAAYYNGGVVALDVSGVLAGTLHTQNRMIASIKPGGGPSNTYAWGVQLYGGSIYAIDMVSGFWKLSPSNLAVVGGGNNVPERFGSDLWVANGYAYTGTWGTRAAVGNTIKIWDVSGASPVIADSLKISGVGTISDLEVSEDGRLLSVSAERGGQSGVYFYSLADPVNPVLLGRAVEANGVHTQSLAYINGRIYAFAAKDPSNSAMLIYDVTDMAQ